MRGHLYYWYSHRLETVRLVAALLWPWLGSVKREQCASVLHRVGAMPAAVNSGGIHTDNTHDLAWAAGFFDGEGSFLASVTDRTRVINASIPQATADGVPEVLLRFQRVTSLGRIGGPRAARGPWSRLPQYRWELAGLRELQELRELLWPWLGEVKRTQADEAFQRYMEPSRAIPSRSSSAPTKTSTAAIVASSTPRRARPVHRAPTS